MAKFIVTLVVETDEGTKQSPPHKKAIKDIIQRSIEANAQFISFEHDIDWRGARVRTVDID